MPTGKRRRHAGEIGHVPLERLRGLAHRQFDRGAIGAAAGDVGADLAAVAAMVARGEERLAGLYASSQASAMWQLIGGLGPLTRAELARALGVTRRTASQAAQALDKAGLAALRPEDRALVPKRPRMAS